MQKVVDIMISHCGLGKDSVFIDVGAGLGKPNIHVAQVNELRARNWVACDGCAGRRTSINVP